MLFVLSLLALAPAHADEYRMNDVGGTVVLSGGWEPEANTWSDEGIKATHPDGMWMKLWLTDFQVPITKDSAAAWAEMYQELLPRFDPGIESVSLLSTEIVELGGRPTALTALRFVHKKGSEGVAWHAAFISSGRVVHIRTLGLKRSAKAVEEELRRLTSAMRIDKGALPEERQVSGSGFSATLPAGWRVPLSSESDAVRKVIDKMGSYSPDNCFVGILPHPVGKPDVTFACGTYLYVGPVDEHSFAGVESEVHAEFFGSASTPVPAATPISIGDRTGFYYKPPIPGAIYRMALAPYDKGMMMTWAVANQLDEPALDAAMTELLSSVTFTGPDGGAPIIGPDKWAMYYLKYRPFSPPVLLGGLLLLGLIGGGVTLARRRRPSYMLDDDDS